MSIFFKQQQGFPLFIMVKSIFSHCDDKSELLGATLKLLTAFEPQVGLVPTDFTVLSEKSIVILISFAIPLLSLVSRVITLKGLKASRLI